MTTFNLWQLFAATAAEFPDREALVWRDRRLTYAHLAGRSRRVGAVLRALTGRELRPRSELRPWECGQPLVGTYLLNCPEYMEVSLGGYAARLAPFNVNYRYVHDELAYLFNDAGADAIVYHERFAPILAEVLPRLRKRPTLVQVADGSGNPLLDDAVDYETLLSGAVDDIDEEQQGDDLYVLYTGGTTGMPKGTLWRQHDLWLGALEGGKVAARHGATPEDLAGLEAAEQLTLLPLPPLMHGAAHWITLRALCTGGRVVLPGVNDHLDVADAWQLVAAERPHAMTMVGEAFARPLLEELDARSYDVSSLRIIANGGAMMSPETKQRFLDRIPGCNIMDGAGSSESGVTLTRVDAGSASDGAVFQPSANTTVVDESRTRVLVPGEDHIGWVATSGPIPLGYLGDEAKTRETFVDIDGVRFTIPGDRARLRTDGMVELLGRDSVTINSGGEKIFVEEVERAVLLAPGVRDAVVVGRPSPRWGNEVVAVVEVDDDVTDAGIESVAQSSIARYKLPKAYVRVDRVRRSPSGKADYAWARGMAIASAGGDHQ